MPAGRILIVYGSSYGQTAKIATRLAELLTDRDMEVTLLRGDQVPAGFSLDSYDGVLVGASLIGGSYQDYIGGFVRANRDALDRLHSAFFAVSGSAGSPDLDARAGATTSMELFLAECGWRPSLTASIAGAMAYSRYGVVLRAMMRRTARQNGETDTRRDREYTDWLQVRRFADQFRALLGAEPAAREAMTAAG